MTKHDVIETLTLLYGTASAQADNSTDVDEAVRASHQATAYGIALALVKGIDL